MPLRRSSTVVTYRLTREEIAVADVARRIAGRLDETRASLLLHRLSSSHLALEATVGRLLEEDNDALPSSAKDELAHLARLLEGLTRDTKLTVCLDVVQAIRERGGSVVVFTAYRDTARYLFDSLLDEREDAYLLTGGQGNNRLQLEAARFLEQGGVAVITDAAIGCDLDRTDIDGLGFDLSRSVTGWNRRWSHIDRVGRIGEARMHVLIADPVSDQELESLMLAGIEFMGE